MSAPSGQQAATTAASSVPNPQTSATINVPNPSSQSSVSISNVSAKSGVTAMSAPFAGSNSSAQGQRSHPLPAIVSTVSSTPLPAPVTHTLKLIPATAAAAGGNDQPVDLATKPKSSAASVTSSSNNAPSTAKSAIQVPNISNLVVAAPSSQPVAPAPQRSPGTAATTVAPIHTHTLRIPSLPLRPATVIPTSGATAAAGAQVIAGPGLATVVGRSGGASVIPRQPATLLTVPKNGTAGQVNLAVVQQVQNKVVLQAPSPGGSSKASTITGITQVPSRASTTIIRPPSAPYPVTIRAPIQHGGASGSTTPGAATTAIRLTAAVSSGSSGTNQPTVQFVPVSLATSGGATLRPAGTVTPGATALPTVSFRGSPAAIVTAPRNQSIEGNAAAGTVRVTLVQTSTSIAKSAVSQATITQSNFYKPVTITTQQPTTTVVGQQKLATSLVPTPLTTGINTSGINTQTAQPVRIGPIQTGPRAMLHNSQSLTVSLTPTSHISVPLAPNIITTKQPLRLPVSVSGGSSKIIQMPLVASANPQGGQPSGVTIQKTTIPANTIPRTISLPYGTTSQASVVAKPASGTVASNQGAAIPVARVTPQRLDISSSSSAGSPNLVTITSTVATGGTNNQSVPSVYIARAPGVSNAQPLAINLSNSGPPKIISQQQRSQLAYDSSGSSGTQIITSASTTATGGKINLPAHPTRFVALPTQPAGSGESAVITTLASPAHTQLLEQDIHRKLMSGQNITASQSSSRPGILGGGREGDRDIQASPSRDVDREDAASSSSGSATLSATSSPGGAGNGDNISGGGDDAPEAPRKDSPREELRKQQFPPSNLQSQMWMSESDQLVISGSPAAATKRKQLSVDHKPAKVRAMSPVPPSGHYMPDKPRISLLNSYRHTWRSRQNHFLRHSDVKVKEDRRPTVNELANQRYVLQKINGWKVYHLSTQMDEIVESEAELTKKLNGLYKRLEKLAHSDLGHKELGRVHELIKANLQRSKVVQDQMKESKDHALELFEHKSKVIEIVNKYVSKRQVKKRELN